MEPLGLAWTTALVAWVAAVPLGRFTMHTITVTHEGGHTLLGVLTGVKVGRIKVNGDGGGETGFPPKIPWLADVLITLAGYLAPSAVGLGGVFLLLHDRAEWVLWISVVMLGLLVFKMGNPLGFVAAIGTGVVLWYVATHWSDQAQLAFTYAWVWFLLIGGARTITGLFWGVRNGDKGSDAAVMQRLTLLGDVVWLAFFWLAAMAALIYGGVKLLHL
ncbi:M50 family metallopeptidase [Actinoplanes bogorensis]|uniref:M50 family metallopeptidase n=1 Tax=Paractinoplanes bogorensis TaxID=1610840 RepID=A0ABS5YJJ3_9ACTN|nr:M50 family metallopeptidase [Actinoplanes bogorensis]MBU2662898.1 M50 family metallopeptidase [Actinoplanes bogorensis]